jgi:type I restriction enzyme S subunit
MSIKCLKIKDFAKVITGGTPSSTNKEFWENGDIPWLNSGELNQGIIRSTRNHITKSGLDRSSAKMMPANSVLMALTGATTGVVGYLTFEACANQSVTGILPSERHTPKYLYYYLKSIRNKVIADAYGGAQPHISQGYVKDILVPLPPLEEQRKIAAILDTADEYRQKTKALIDKYDQLTQSLFLDMFGDPVTNPKGWDVKPFTKLVSDFNSQRVPLKSSDRAAISGNIPYYGASGIIDFVNDYTHDGEYVLIGEDGANLLTRNKPIAFLAKGKIWVNNHAHVLKNRHDSRLEFIEFLINSIDLEPYITGSAQPKLNKGNLGRIRVYAPPVNLQNQFAESVELIEKQKQQAEASLVKAEELFNSLLQRAFKGELTN